MLSDFGEARFGNVEHNDDIMPNVYRAPEVVLKMNWDCKVYIWSVATMVYIFIIQLLSHILTLLFVSRPGTLFAVALCSPGQNTDGIFDDRVHLAEMVALLGLPPAEFGKRSRVGHVFFDNDGMYLTMVEHIAKWLLLICENVQADGKTLPQCPT